MTPRRVTQYPRYFRNLHPTLRDRPSQYQEDPRIAACRLPHRMGTRKLGFELRVDRLSEFLGLQWPVLDQEFEDTNDRFDTHDHSDLIGVYETLIGTETCDPFEDSAEAVDAYNEGAWLPLLKHNLADIQRTRELAELAGRFVAQSDFKMKNLEPPRQ